MKSTLYKYLISYIVLFLIFAVGAIASFELQVKDELIENHNESRLDAVDYTASLVSLQLEQLQAKNDSLKQELPIFLYSYSELSSRYFIANELLQEKKENFLIDEIIYINTERELMISNSYPMEMDGDFYRMQTSDGSLYLKKDQLEGNYTMKLMVERVEEKDVLFFLPQNTNAISFQLFVINEQELEYYFNGKNQFDTLGIIDGATGEILYQVGKESSVIFDETFLSESDSIFRDIGGNYVHLSSLQHNSYRIFGLESKEAVVKNQQDVFYRVYTTLLLFGVVAFAFICYAFQITYVPLYRLTKKLSKDKTINKNYLQTIDHIFEDKTLHVSELEEKIKQYQGMFFEQVLGNFVGKNSDYQEMKDSMTQMFNSDRDHAFYIVQIRHAKPNVDTRKKVMEYIKTALGSEGLCLLLDGKMGDDILLIDDTNQYQEKNNVFVAMLEEICEIFECKIALSNASDKPTEISTLFENVKILMEMVDVFAQDKVVQYNESFRDAEKGHHYPNEILTQMSAMLEMRNYQEVKQAVAEILESLEVKSLPEFYVKCILIDMVTVIFKSASQNKVPYDNYKDNYLELLNLIRNFHYRKKKVEIQKLMVSLVDTCEHDGSNSVINIELIQEYIQHNYHDFNFSLSRLASEVGVSGAYLSYLYKKTTGDNLSDYVWLVRQEKIIRLLETTNLTIEEISVQVGYDNVSSLRRKFKKETGKTPNQYRK